MERHIPVRPPEHRREILRQNILPRRLRPHEQQMLPRKQRRHRRLHHLAPLINIARPRHPAPRRQSRALRLRSRIRRLRLAPPVLRRRKQPLRHPLLPPGRKHLRARKTQASRNHIFKHQQNFLSKTANHNNLRRTASASARRPNRPSNRTVHPRPGGQGAKRPPAALPSHAVPPKIPHPSQADRERSDRLRRP